MVRLELGEVLAMVGSVVAIISLIFVVLNFNKTMKKTLIDETAYITTIKTEIKYLTHLNERVLAEQVVANTILGEHNTRITRSEEKINHIEQKVDKMEKVLFYKDKTQGGYNG